MSARIERLVGATRVRLERVRSERPLAELEHLASSPDLASEARPFREALSGQGTAVIAEHKRRSPSAGVIREGAAVGDLVGAYERGGAAALSILTEEDHFGGTLADLSEARAATSLPILRKDFVLDPYQLYEAKAAGADAVLLVVGALTSPELAELYAEARRLDLDALVEVHTEQDLEAALDLDVDVIGVNNRDLEDLQVDLRHTFELLPRVPAGKVVVSESGIASRADVEDLEAVGVDAVLVGEALMRAADPEAAVRALGAGDEGAGGGAAAPER